MRADEWDEAEQQHLQAAFEGQTREQILTATFAQVEAASTLLGQKSNEVEDGEYKHWVITVAQAVAHASKEGGFLGIGGQRVSTAEKDFIDRLAQALVNLTGKLAWRYLFKRGIPGSMKTESFVVSAVSSAQPGRVSLKLGVRVLYGDIDLCQCRIAYNLRTQPMILSIMSAGAWFVITHGPATVHWFTTYCI